MREAEAVKAKSAQITGNGSTCKNMWGRHFGVFKRMSGMSERPGFVSHKTTKKQHRPRNTRYVTCDQALFSFRSVKHSGGTGETKKRA